MPSRVTPYRLRLEGYRKPGFIAGPPADGQEPRRHNFGEILRPGRPERRKTVKPFEFARRRRDLGCRAGAEGTLGPTIGPSRRGRGAVRGPRAHPPKNDGALGKISPAHSRPTSHAHSAFSDKVISTDKTADEGSRYVRTALKATRRRHGTIHRIGRLRR